MSSRIWLAKVSRGNCVGLIPTDEDSHAVIARLGDGECCSVSISRPRSVAWHRMYFGICREIGRNQDPERDEASIDAEIRVRSGHYDVLLIDGHEVRVPKRIAFDHMSADEWAEYWKRAEIAIAERFGPEYLREMGR